MSKSIKAPTCGCGCGDTSDSMCGCCGMKLSSGCDCPDDADADHQLTWARVTIEDLEKALWCCSTEGVSLVEQLKEKDQRIKELEEKIITLRCIGKKYKNKLVEINDLLLDPDLF